MKVMYLESMCATKSFIIDSTIDEATHGSMEGDRIWKYFENPTHYIERWCIKNYTCFAVWRLLLEPIWQLVDNVKIMLLYGAY